MARRRTTIRRIDPWSILKFGFVANLVLLGIQLLAGAVIWYVIQRLELIQTVCELAATVGFEECGVDGGALFDTFLVLGLLGVVIQTGILVFLAFLANLIFDLTGGIGITLEDDRAPSGNDGQRSGIGSRSSGATAFSGASAGRSSRSGASSDSGSSGRETADTTQSVGAGFPTSSTDGNPPVPPVGSEAQEDHGGQSSDSSTGTGSRRDDDTLFGG